MRSVGLVALAVILVAAGCGGSSDEAAPSPPPPPPPATAPAPTEPEEETGPLRLETVAEDLESPTHVAQAPGGAELYVVERPGTIRVVEEGRVRAEPFLDLTSQVQSG